MQEDRSEQGATSTLPSKKSKGRGLLKQIHKFLSESEIFSSFPLSLLLLGLEEIIEIEFFLCPCQPHPITLLPLFIFIGPALFTFALMCLLLRPFSHRCSCAESNECIEKNKNEKNKKNETTCSYAFASCLIPPVMWIIILLLDGDYVACGFTYWKGVYVFDNQLNRAWCKPTDETENKTVLQDLTRKYIHQSQLSGYILMSIISVLLVVLSCCAKQSSCSSGAAEAQRGHTTSRTA